MLCVAAIPNKPVFQNPSTRVGVGRITCGSKSKVFAVCGVTTDVAGSGLKPLNCCSKCEGTIVASLISTGGVGQASPSQASQV